MAEVQIPISLGNRIIFVKNVKAKPSSHRGRAPGFLRITPIDSRKQVTELGRGDRHRAVSSARPQEAAPFQPLREQAGSLAVRSPSTGRLCDHESKTAVRSADRAAAPPAPVATGSQNPSSCQCGGSHTRTPLGNGIMAAFQARA
jgi:hypothetical protein